MHKVVVLYPPQPNPERFRAYYEETHLPLARKLPGLMAMRHTFDVATPGGESPYSCVFEAEFADGAALDAAMGSPEGQAVAGDVPNFAEVPPTLIIYPCDNDPL